MNIDCFLQLKQCISEDFYCEKLKKFPPQAGFFSQNPVPKPYPEKPYPEISNLQKVRGGWDPENIIKFDHPYCQLLFPAAQDSPISLQIDLILHQIPINYGLPVFK